MVSDSTAMVSDPIEVHVNAMSFRIRLAIAVLATLPTLGDAQSRPDFSGEWVAADSALEQRSVASVGDASFRVGTPGNGWRSPLTIRQLPNQLVVEFAFFSTYDLQPRLRFTYALDGSESRNAVMIGHAETLLRSRAAWRDSALVITTAYPLPGGNGTTEVRQALTLASPTSLVVETLFSGSPAVVRTTYTRR
jgi:hypothetical protein